jgi:hypothetical protein
LCVACLWASSCLLKGLGENGGLASWQLKTSNGDGVYSSQWKNHGIQMYSGLKHPIHPILLYNIYHWYMDHILKLYVHSMK